MADTGLSSRVIERFGRTCGDHIDDAPDMVRRALVLGFSLKRLQTRRLPDRTLLPSSRMAARLTLEQVTGALEHPDEMVVTSIFLPNEVFHCLGLRPVTAEAITEFISGAWAEDGFATTAEEAGIPETFCSYHRVLLGAAFSGVLPPAPMVASCSVACDANNLTFKALEDSWGCRRCYVDVPYDATREACDYVAGQLREMADVAQDAFGRRLDEELLSQAVARSMTSLDTLAATVPGRSRRYLANDMTTELYFALCEHLMLGTEEGVELFSQLGRDLETAEPFEGTSLFWMHMTPYHLVPFQEALNASRATQIVGCDMTFDQVGLGERWFGAERPYHAMAERLVRNAFNGPAERRAEHAVRLARESGADGAVIFCHWGCKNTMGASQLFRATFEQAGIPVLVLDGDGCMRSNCPAGQMSTRLAAFLELLGSREVRDA